MRFALASTLVLLVGTAGCAVRPSYVSLPRAPLDVDAFIAERPLPSNEPIRAEQIGRTDGASYHIVQVWGSERPHRHVTHDFTVLVLRGRGVLTRAGGRIPLIAGDTAVVPRGEPHWFASEGSESAVALVIFTPPMDAPDAVPADER